MELTKETLEDIIKSNQKKRSIWPWKKKRNGIELTPETLEAIIKANSKKKKRKAKVIAGAAGLAFAALISGITYVGYKFYDIHDQAVNEPRIEYTREGLEELGYEDTRILDKNEKKLSSNIGHDSEHAVHTKRMKPEDMPPAFKELLLASEDSRFYEHFEDAGINLLGKFPYLDIYHNSIDITGMIRAAFNMIQGESLQGGSTLTMQLAERIAETYRLEMDSDSCNDMLWGLGNYLPDKINLKICEITNAMTLSENLEPDEIISEYANLIYVNGNVVGLNNAMKYYFDQERPEMEPSLSQLAFIVGSVKGPENYNPFKGETETRLEKLQAARDRTVTILRDRYLPVKKEELKPDAYAELEKRTMEEIEDLEKRIAINRQEIEENRDLEGGFFQEGQIYYHASHISDRADEEVDLLVEMIREKLEEKGYTGEFKRDRIIEMITSIDAEMQQHAEYLLQHHGSEWYMQMTREYTPSAKEKHHKGNSIKEAGLYYAKVEDIEKDDKGKVSKIMTNIGVIDKKALDRIRKHTRKDPENIINDKGIIYVSVRPGVKGKERLLDIEQDKLPFGGGIITAEPSTGGIEVMANMPSSNMEDIDYINDVKKQPGSLGKIFVHAMGAKYGINLDDTFNNAVLPQADLFNNKHWIVRNSHYDATLKTAFKGFSDSDNALHVNLLKNIFLFSPELYEKALEKHGLEQRDGESNDEYMFRIFDGRDRACAYDKELSMTGGCPKASIYGIESNKGQMDLAAFEQAWKDTVYSLIATGKEHEPLMQYWHGIGHDDVRNITLAHLRSKRLDRYSKKKKERKISKLEEQLEADNLNRRYLLPIHNQLMDAVKELRYAIAEDDSKDVKDILEENELYLDKSRINVNLQTRDLEQLIERDPVYMEKFGERLTYDNLMPLLSTPESIVQILGPDNIYYNGDLPMNLVEAIERRIEDGGYNTEEWQDSHQHLNPELRDAIAVRELKELMKTLGADIDDRKTDGLSAALGAKELTPESMMQALQTIWNEGMQCRPHLIKSINYDTGYPDLGDDGIIRIELDPVCKPVYNTEKEKEEYALIAERIQEIMRAPTFGTARRSGDHISIEMQDGTTIENEVLYKTGTSQKNRDAWAAAISGNPAAQDDDSELLKALESSHATLAVGAVGNYLIDNREAGMRGHGSRIEGSDAVYMIHQLFRWMAEDRGYGPYVDPETERLGFKKRDNTGESFYINRSGSRTGCHVIDEEHEPGKSKCLYSEADVYLSTPAGNDRRERLYHDLQKRGINPYEVLEAGKTEEQIIEEAKREE